MARDSSELGRWPKVIGRKVQDLRAAGIAGSPGEALDRLGTRRERTGIHRIYLLMLDLTGLD